MTTAPLRRTIQATIPALGAAVAGDQTIGEAPFAGSVSAVWFTPEADIVGHATNNRTLTLVNKGADGNGATVVATLAFLAGVNASDFDEIAFTLGVPANLVVAEGDIFAVVEAVGASGLANPGGLIQVTVDRG